MKPQTEKALRGLDRRQRIELVAFMADICTTDEFIDALHKDQNRANVLSSDGEAVYSELLTTYGDHLIDRDEAEGDFDRMHEAICEGRAQDALDLLASITGLDFRPAAVQNRLFPARAPTLTLEF